jgi:hypothetical protein
MGRGAVGACCWRSAQYVRVYVMIRLAVASVQFEFAFMYEYDLV